MKQTRKKNGAQQESIILSGEITVNQVRDLQELIKLHIDDAHDIKLNLDAVTEIDIPCLQLICSAHRTYQSAGHNLSIDGKVPDIVRQALDKAGFSRKEGCHFDKNHTCLWVYGR